MREILFRGKRKDNEEWVEGYYVHLYDGKRNESHRIYSGTAETDCGEFYEDFFEVDPETVGQFTGLYDGTKWEDLTEKERSEFTRSGNFPSEWRGKKIFEGDIVYSIYSKKNYPVLFGEYTYIDDYGNECDACGWYNEEVGYSTAFGNPEEWAEVIGNIHDNPDFLSAK